MFREECFRRDLLGDHFARIRIPWDMPLSMELEPFRFPLGRSSSFKELAAGLGGTGRHGYLFIVRNTCTYYIVSYVTIKRYTLLVPSLSEGLMTRFWCSTLGYIGYASAKKKVEAFPLWSRGLVFYLQGRCVSRELDYVLFPFQLFPGDTT